MPAKKCPECGSFEIYLWMGGRLGVLYECKECGYRGALVVEDDERH